MTEKELNKEIKNLRNPSVILCDFCNRLVEKFDSKLMFTDPQEVVREAYDEEKKSLIARMQKATAALIDKSEDPNGLIAEANKLINPDDK
jgi:hypothetical protein